MRMRVALPTAVAAAIAITASAQQSPPPTPPQPAFAAPNLSEAGVRAMAANCAMCHGTEGRQVAGSTVPGLAGRPADTLVDALKAFKDGKREATIMHQIAKGYSDAEIAALAAWFAKQPR